MPRVDRKAARIDAFLVLYAAGWSDSRITQVLRGRNNQARRWREERGLPKNARPFFKIDPALALEMYDGGATDGQIARRFGATQSGATRWRQRRGLSPNIERAPRYQEPVRRRAKKMLRFGATISQVSTELGMGAKAVSRCRRAIRGAPGLRPTGLCNSAIRRRVLSDPSIERRITRALGSSLPRDIRQDAFTDLYLAVIEGKVAAEFIEQVAPSYRNRAFEMCGSKFGPRSLNEELAEDWTLGDTLEDAGALDQMERAAEAAYGNDNW